MSDEYRRGLEDAAKLADFYAVENFRLAGDTIMRDPVMSRSVGEALVDMGATLDQLDEASVAMMQEGHMHSSMAHAAQNIAQAIRELDGKASRL